jgi:NADH dehydrogenase FAD-containing subunit
MAFTIVILGGSYAGLTLAHKLLKDTLPSVPDLQVILISPSSHLYWNLASVRAVIPGALHNPKISKSFLPNFAYAASAFKFIQGTAEKVDDANKLVVVRTENGQTVTKFFDYCVVATGRRAMDEMPWTAGGLKIEKTLRMVKVLQERIERANSIVIGGGGVCLSSLPSAHFSHQSPSASHVRHRISR